MYFKKWSVLLFSAISLLLTACNGGGYDRAQIFVNELNSYYGHYDFTLVKRHGYDDSNFIVVYDNYYNEYTAFNLQFFQTGDSFSNYLGYSGFFDIQTNLIPRSGGLYYNPGTGMYFESTQGTPKDLEKVAAFMEEKKLAKQGEEIASKFGLSESRGREVAKLARQWDSIKKKRSMTDADLKVFSRELLGVDMTDAQKSVNKFLKGDEKALERLIEKAAAKNGTDPENMNELFKEYLMKN